MKFKTRGLNLGLLISLGLIFSACSWFGKSKSVTNLELAQQSIDKGESTIALNYISQAITENPKDFQAYYLRAKFYQQYNDYDNANSNYVMAIIINKSDYNLLMDYGKFLCLRGLYPNALHIYDLALKTTNKPESIPTQQEFCKPVESTINNTSIQSLEPESSNLVEQTPVVNKPVIASSEVVTAPQAVKGYPALEIHVASGRKYIIVQKGDTLYNISVRSGVSQTRLKKINRIKHNNVLLGTRVYLN